jgi:hypothetical protein
LFTQLTERERRGYIDWFFKSCQDRYQAQNDPAAMARRNANKAKNAIARREERVSHEYSCIYEHVTHKSTQRANGLISVVRGVESELGAVFGPEQVQGLEKLLEPLWLDCRVEGIGNVPNDVWDQRKDKFGGVGRKDAWEMRHMAWKSENVSRKSFKETRTNRPAACSGRAACL